MSEGVSAASTTAPNTTTTPKQRRRRVVHWYWVAAADAAEELGVGEVPSICRRAWVKLGNRDDEESLTPKRVAEHTRRVDCGACVASYWAAMHRNA